MAKRFLVQPEVVVDVKSANYQVKLGEFVKYDGSQTMKLTFPSLTGEAINSTITLVNMSKVSVAQFDPNGAEAQVPGAIDTPWLTNVAFTPFGPRTTFRYITDGTVWLLDGQRSGKTPVHHIVGGYQPGTTYDPGDMARDGQTVGVAINRTQDRVAPQPQGAQYWVSGLGDTPAWEEVTDPSGNQIVTGQRYTLGATTGFQVVQYRPWIPEINPLINYRLVLVENPTTNPVYHVLINEIPQDSVGWITLNLPQAFWIPGDERDLIQIASSEAGLTTFNGFYDYKRSSGDPGEGEINHQGNGWDMRIHYTDENSTDLETELRSLNPGDLVSGGGLDWDILDTDERSSHTRLTVDPATRIGQEEKYTFTFSQFTATPIKYVRIVNHYSGNAEVQGLFSDTGYDPSTIVPDQNAYGVDIRVQNLQFSPDWDLIGFINPGG